VYNKADLSFQEVVEEKRPQERHDFNAVVDEFMRTRKAEIVAELNKSTAVQQHTRSSGVAVNPTFFCVSAKSMQWAPRDGTAEARELAEDANTRYVDSAQVFSKRSSKRFVYVRGSRWEGRKYSIFDEPDFPVYLSSFASARLTLNLRDSAFKVQYNLVQAPRSVPELWGSIEAIIRAYYHYHATPAASPTELAAHTRTFFEELQQRVCTGVVPDSLTPAVIAVRAWTSDTRGPVHDRALYRIVNWALSVDDAEMMAVCCRYVFCSTHHTHAAQVPAGAQHPHRLSGSSRG